MNECQFEGVSDGRKDPNADAARMSDSKMRKASAGWANMERIFLVMGLTG
jgi:hypothetical protein